MWDVDTEVIYRSDVRKILAREMRNGEPHMVLEGVKGFVPQDACKDVVSGT